MSHAAPFLLLFCGVLFLTKDVMSDFHLMRMPSAHRRMATAMLGRCRELNDQLANETVACNSHIRRMRQATRCRSLNAHIEMAEARLNRLEEFMMMRQLESLHPLLTGCQERKDARLREVERLEAEKLDIQQSIADLHETLDEQAAREQAIVFQTDILREEEKAVGCEITRLETERRMLEKQLELQNTTFAALSSHGEAQSDQLMEVIEAAAADQEREVGLCKQKIQQFEHELAFCQDQVSRVEKQLHNVNEPLLQMRTQLEEDLTICQKQATSCENTTSVCAAELKNTSSQILNQEMAALAERGRLQGCQREKIASQSRLNKCRSTGRLVYSRIQALKRELSSGSVPTERLDHCNADVSSCTDKAKSCGQKLSSLREGEEGCKLETSDWRARWQRCNDSVTKLEHDKLAPLQTTSNDIEKAVNETVARGNDCENEGLHIRADRGFAEEDLLRKQSVLNIKKKQLSECQMHCWDAETGEGSAPDLGADTYDMSDWEQ